MQHNFFDKTTATKMLDLNETMKEELKNIRERLELEKKDYEKHVNIYVPLNLGYVGHDIKFTRLDNIRTCRRYLEDIKKSLPLLERDLEKMEKSDALKKSIEKILNGKPITNDDYLVLNGFIEDQIDVCNKLFNDPDTFKQKSCEFRSWIKYFSYDEYSTFENQEQCITHLKSRIDRLCKLKSVISGCFASAAQENKSNYNVKTSH